MSDLVAGERGGEAGPPQAWPNLADISGMWPVGGARGALRARAVTGVMVGVAAVGFWAVMLTGTASASHKQTPILECVFHDTGTGQWNSLWGYDSTSGSVENIPIGSTNYFSPGAQNQGQPTAFQPGTNNNVFTVTWSGSSELTWTLNGQSASATTSSTKCGSNPVSIVPGTNGWFLALPVAFLALGILGVGFCCWRYDFDLIAGRRQLFARRQQSN